MKPITLEEFRRRVTGLHGETLTTLHQGREFTLHVTPSGLEYTPAGSGTPRPDSWERISNVIGRYNDMGSLQPGDYVDVTHNSSYVLTLVARLFPGTRSTHIEVDRSPPVVTMVTPESSAPRRPHQRVGSISNAHVGADFEQVALRYFASQGVPLSPNFPLQIGVREKKMHCFDLGNAEKRVIVECKSHRWTEGSRVPSAKMTVWNEAMYYFLLAPEDYRKVLFILHDRRPGSGETLLAYYLRTYPHLIPPGVEFLEWDEATGDLIRT